MFNIPNAIKIELGNVLQGSAEGPIGIGALVIIALKLSSFFADQW
jgi:hypothetical protein